MNRLRRIAADRDRELDDAAEAAAALEDKSEELQEDSAAEVVEAVPAAE